MVVVEGAVVGGVVVVGVAVGGVVVVGVDMALELGPVGPVVVPGVSEDGDASPDVGVE